MQMNIIFKIGIRFSLLTLIVMFFVISAGMIGCSGEDGGKDDTIDIPNNTQNLEQVITPCSGDVPLPGCGRSCVVGVGNCVAGTYCGSGNVCTADCSASIPCKNGLGCETNGKCTKKPEKPSKDNNSTSNTASTDNNTSANDNTDTDNEACISQKVETREILPTVTILVDRSGSMGGVVLPKVNRWDAVKTAIIGADAADGGLVKKFDGKVRLGLATYTAYSNLERYVPGPDDYNPFSLESYPEKTIIISEPGESPVKKGVCPQLDVDVLPSINSIAEIETAYRDLDRGRGSGAETPTAEAVSAIAQRLGEIKEEGPKVIILATDGNPDTCEVPDSEDLNKKNGVEPWEDGYALGLVKARKAVHDAYEKQGVKTYIISVGDIKPEHLQDIANLGVGLSADIRNKTVDDGGNEVNAKCHSLAGTTGDAAPCWEAKGSGAIDGLREAITGIIESERTCIVQVNGKFDSPEAVCDGVVKLNGESLTCNGADGFVYKTSEAIELKGKACDTYKLPKKAVIDATWPCEKIIINTDGDFSPTGGFNSSSFR